MTIKQVLNKSKVPVKIWTDDVESSALEQLEQLANVPGIGPWVSVMPDVHFGMGATIGSVIPTRDIVIPTAVGVDIGCGIQSVRTNLKRYQFQDIEKSIREQIEEVIPTGFSGNRNISDEVNYWCEENELSHLDSNLKEKVALQLGTLGGG